MRGSGRCHQMLALAVLATVVAGCAPGPTATPTTTAQKGPQLELGRGRYWDDLPEADAGPDQLAGRWIVRWREVGEWADPGIGLVGFDTVEFVGDLCVLTGVGDLSAKPVDFLVTFRSNWTPRELDLTAERGVIEGIYKLTRDGRLLIALAFYDPERAQPLRPPAFDPTRSPALLLVCEREDPH